MESERSSNDLDTQKSENLKYDSSKSTVDILLDISCDPNLNFYKINIKNIITPFIIPENFHILLDDSASESFSVLHLNIRSMNKKLWKLLKFLGRLKEQF